MAVSTAIRVTQFGVAPVLIRREVLGPKGGDRSSSTICQSKDLFPFLEDQSHCLGMHHGVFPEELLRPRIGERQQEPHR